MSENTVNKNQNHNNQNVNLNSSAEKDLMLGLLMLSICHAIKIGYLLIEIDKKYGTNLFETAMASEKSKIQNIFESQ